MDLIRERTEQENHLYQTQAEVVKILKKKRGQKGRGSSLSSRSRMTESGYNFDLNPYSDDRVTLSQYPLLGRQHDLPATPLVPPYIPMPV